MRRTEASTSVSKVTVSSPAVIGMIGRSENLSVANGRQALATSYESPEGLLSASGADSRQWRQASAVQARTCNQILDEVVIVRD